MRSSFVQSRTVCHRPHVDTTFLCMVASDSKGCSHTITSARVPMLMRASIFVGSRSAPATVLSAVPPENSTGHLKNINRLKAYCEITT